MSIKWIFIHLFILTLSLASFAQADAEKPSLLYQAMQVRVKTLSRPIDTYHWSNAQKFSSPQVLLNSTNESAKDYVEKHAEAFKLQVDDPHDVLGPGLYLAVDPVATLYYGGKKDWVLLQLPFKTGTKYLDLRDEAGLDLSPEIRTELNQEGCPVDEFGSFLKLAQIGACKRLFTTICEQLDVDLVAYSYTTMQFQHLPERDQTSFILASDKNIDWTRFRAFSENVSKSASDSFDRFIIEHSFSQMIPPKWLTGDQPVANLDKFIRQLEPWKDIPTGTQEDWLGYVQLHFLEAGSFNEDQPK